MICRTIVSSTAHGINRDNATLDSQQLQEFRDRGDFVGLALGLELDQMLRYFGEHQAIMTRPPAIVPWRGQKSLNGFTIKRDHGALRQLRYRLGPG